MAPQPTADTCWQCKHKTPYGITTAVGWMCSTCHDYATDRRLLADQQRDRALRHRPTKAPPPTQKAT